MSKITSKQKNLFRRKNRIRATVIGTSERPRMSVSITNQHVSIQIIDDSKSHTLAFATTIGEKTAPDNMTKKAAWAGTEIGKAAKKAKITKVVFDRNGKMYHGRIKALADAARAEGMEF